MSFYRPAPITLMAFGRPFETQRLIARGVSDLAQAQRALITVVLTTEAAPRLRRLEEGRRRTPVTIMLFGPPASGKTTLINRWAANLTARDLDRITFGETTLTPDCIASGRYHANAIDWKDTRPPRRLYVA